MATYQYCTQKQPFGLGKELGRGGEGIVYEIVGDPNSVAKIYHQPVLSSQAEKLKTMAQLATPELLRIAAWPTAAIERASSGLVVGFLMPRLTNYRAIHSLYSPAQRRAEFPRADWAFLIHTARNLAAAFATIHKDNRFVIGDVSQKNVWVSSDAEVKLVDCDSFQISMDRKKFLCEVATSEFTPPELHGKPLNRLLRTPNHDNFGLAVLCFLLLFMGRHPFAGRFHGQGDMPIERAIREFRFSFSQLRPTSQMSPPPFSLGLGSTSRSITNLFERAFGPEAVRAGRRPNAQEWIAALEALGRELAKCGMHAGHKFFRGARQCPWCEIERNGGPDFFSSVAETINVATGFDLQFIWRHISSIPAPEPANRLVPVTSATLPTPTPLPAGVHSGFLAILFSSKYREERRRRLQALKAAEAGLYSAESRWRRDIDNAVKRFHAKFQALVQMKAEYENLTSVSLPSYTPSAQAIESQRIAFLRQHLIRQASVKNVGSGRQATLASYGIETAADITYNRVMQVPGFGSTLTQNLLDWRAVVEQHYRFSPLQYRQNLEQMLSMGAHELQQMRTIVEQRKFSRAAELQHLAARFEQAKADASLI